MSEFFDRDRLIDAILISLWITATVSATMIFLTTIFYYYPVIGVSLTLFFVGLTYYTYTRDIV